MFDKILRAVRRRAASALGLQSHGAQPTKAAILDQYVRTTPSPQNALDVFKGDWWSKFPSKDVPLQAGTTTLF